MGNINDYYGDRKINKEKNEIVYINLNINGLKKWKEKNDSLCNFLH